MDLIVRGSPIFAATGGQPFDRARPTVVLLHGAGMDHSVWAYQSRALAAAGRGVLALDLPGHGRSGGEALGSIGELADWLAALLDAAGIERAVIAGHSLGALVALDFAARHPARTRALGLVGAAAAMPVHEDLLKAAKGDLPRAVAMITTWGFGAGAALGGSPSPGLWMVGGGAALLRRSRPGVLHADLAACNAYRDGEAAAGRVAVPTRVVIGGNDRMSPPKAGLALAGLIAGAAPVVVEGAGHILMAERPEAVLDALLAL